MENNKEVLYAGKFVSLVRVGHWEYAQRSKNVTGIVAMVACTPNNEVVLVEQHRPPCGGRVIEFPAGLVGDKSGLNKESLEEAAQRELLEETGYQAEKMVYLTEGPASAGITSEIITFYRAENVTLVGPGGGDESENIRVHLVPLDAVDEWLKHKMETGVQVDLKVFTGLYFLTKKRT
ncbi:MAG: NUDIX hydrolase [Candidatus Bruticola sp.]